MKLFPLALGVAVLLTGCNQTAPVTSAPAAAPVASAAPAAPETAAVAPAAVAPAVEAPATTAPVAPEAVVPTAPQALKAVFAFKPAPNPDDPRHPRTSAHLLLQGAVPQDIDLGKFVARPDVVDAAKAKLANFPKDMLMGFRCYQASTGTSFDLAVLHIDSRHLRIVQRRVEETAPGEFKTAREIPFPTNTTVTVGASAKK